jgi:Na+-driven multidrug efflux pump
MLVDIFSGFCLLPPATYLFGVIMGWGLIGAWIALLLWFSLYAFGMVFWFIKGDWKSIKV